MKVCPAAATVEGIDVSKYQETIDWPAVRAAGKEFAFIRVSDGIHSIDEMFERNWEGAKKAGVLVGAYQFFRPGQDPTSQAELLLHKLSRLAPADLPCVLDAETTDKQDGAGIVGACSAWIDAVAGATKRQPIVYTGSGFWNQLPASSIPKRSTLWVANWTSDCPSLPTGWDSWKFWQYSEKGHVVGINRSVDLNRFNGSSAELRLFAGGAATTIGITARSATWPVALASIGAITALGVVYYLKRNR